MNRKTVQNKKIALTILITVLITLFSPILNSKINFNTLAYNSDEFVTTWKTNNTGTSNSTSITIPTNTAEWTYLYDVDWTCDGTFDDFGITGNITHDYGTAGTYNVCIRGTFPQIYFNYSGDRLKILDVKQWGSVGWKSMKNAFYGAENLTGTATDAPVWDPTITEISFANAFRVAKKFDGAIGNWDTNKVTNMSSTFHYASVFNQPIGEWNTSKVKTMYSMFELARNFNQPIGDWVTDSLVDMRSIFRSASAFNQDINDWNVSNIKSMENVFNAATRFNKPLDKWNMGNVESLSNMFASAQAFNQPIGSWDVRKVRDMMYMFSGATTFNQDIGSWQTNSLVRTWSMFYGATAFNQDIGNWNTSLLYDSRNMFQNATSFNQPFTNWNTSKLQMAGNMFNGATAFNQDISHFNIPILIEAPGMLNNSGMSTEHYDALLNAWAGQPILKTNVAFGATGIYYCTAKPARDILTGAPNNWTITDGGQNCPPQNLTLSNTEVNEHTTEVGYLSANSDRPITYSLVSGEGSEDNSKFALNTTTGYLTFLNAPDFENPTDLGDTPNNNTYSIRVRATDNNAQYSEAIFIITVKDIDDVGPVTTITAPTKIAKGPITDTTFTVSDRFSIASVQVDTSSVAAADNIVCQPAPGSTTHSTDFPFINDAPSPTNHLTLNCTIRVTTSGKLVLKATDNAGYSTTATEEGYIIDTLGPTFSVANVDTTINGLHNPVVSFEAHDPVGVQKYEIIFIQDNNGPGISPNQTIETVQYTGGVQQLTISLDPHEASHVVEIKAYDNVGNTTSRRITFPPVVTINAPTIISNQPIDDTTVTITSPTNGNLIDNIVISGSASAGVTLGTCTDKNNNTTAPYNTTVTCEIHGIQATGMVAIEAQDITSGAIGSNLQKYFYDTSAPNIIITAPTKIKNDNITDVTIAVTDNIDLFSNSVTIDGSTTAGYNNLVCNTDENDKSIVNCTLTITSSGNLVIKATDKAGNFSTAIESNFIIDRTAPVVTIDTPVAVNYNNQVNYTLSGTCTAGDNDLIVTIGIQPYVAICGVDGTWSLLVDLSSYTDGEIVVSVKQTDAVGNQTTEGATLQKDTIPLVVIINQTAIQHDPTNTQPIRFSIIFSESIKEDTFTKEDINVTGSTTYQKGNITKISDIEYEFEITNLTDGDTVTVDIPAGVCTDLAGNNNLISTSIDNSVTYDITRPSVTINQATTQTDPTSTNSVKYTVIFSEKIDDSTFTKEDILLTGSSTAKVKSITQIDDTEHEVEIEQLTDRDTVTATIPANVLTDLAGNENIASTSTDNSVTYDASSPKVTVNQAIDQADPTNINSAIFTIIFSEPIKEDTFTQDDLAISGSSTATVSQLTKVNETTYTATLVNMVLGETVTLTLPANKVEDLTGKTNEASTSTDNSVTYTVEEEEDETPTPPVIPTPLYPKPIVKPKNPFAKYINPIIEEVDTTTEEKREEETSTTTTKQTTSPTQSKNLRVKIYDKSKKPIKGATVEIHSDIRTEITDENGEAYFENIDTGLHTMIISYNGYRAEREINLINDGEEEMEINVKVEKVSNINYWLIALIILLTILLIYKIYKEKRKDK